ncbi:MAG: FAD-dependent oxidoreductase [Lachnospiraceae bacterium]|nr:FAD-dependent oxidoreductase [Lachnospiraceae bacterium]
MYDIGIVGGGAAGMTAAVYGQRAGKRTIIFEGTTFGGQIASSLHVENYPGIASISGAEFSFALLKQAKDQGAETKQAQVIDIKEIDGVMVIQTADEKISCKTVIIASGVTPRKLGIPKERELIGAGVSYCATCDGAFFRGLDVAVNGGGNTALEDAEFLSNYCNRVYLIHRRDAFRGEESLVEVLRGKENVEFVLNSTIKEIVGETEVTGLVLVNKETEAESTIDVSGVFVAIGQVPDNERFGGIVSLDSYGFVLSAEDCMTSHPQIFAAGDCRTKEVRQLTTAAADGAVAALAACKYLAFR